ncbi:MAG: hypothetical protein PQJ46_07765, partial [Spirochaetales bacterium]|nr:hypothetical protein [Spirochaetales bacterium]
RSCKTSHSGTLLKEMGFPIFRLTYIKSSKVLDRFRKSLLALVSEKKSLNQSSAICISKTIKILMR